MWILRQEKKKSLKTTYNLNRFNFTSFPLFPQFLYHCDKVDRKKGGAKVARLLSYKWTHFFISFFCLLFGYCLSSKLSTNKNLQRPQKNDLDIELGAMWSVSLLEIKRKCNKKDKSVFILLWWLKYWFDVLVTAVIALCDLCPVHK